MATTLAAFHSAGVIHRDLKPQNVLFALGNPEVIDFGIARAYEATSQHTRTGELVGTVAYMAPERLDPQDHEMSYPADIFSRAVVVAYAATGHTPFYAGSPTGTAIRILPQPPDLGGIPAALRDVVARALSKEPDERPTARELVDFLVGGGPDPSVRRQRAAYPRQCRLTGPTGPAPESADPAGTARPAESGQRPAWTLWWYWVWSGCTWATPSTAP